MISLDGELDIATRSLTAQAIEQAVGDSDYDKLTVDLTQLRFMDFSGIHVLASASRELAGRGGALLIRVAPSGYAREVLELLGELAGLDGDRSLIPAHGLLSYQHSPPGFEIDPRGRGLS